jgi:hypothetical protein
MMQQVTTTKQSKKGASPILAPSTTPDTEIEPVTSPGQSTALTTIAEVEAVLGEVATQTLPATKPIPDLVGGDVFYVLPHTNQRRPGTITFDYETEGLLVDITVFTRGKLDGYPEGTQGYNGVIPVGSVSYAPATERQPGTWHWRTEVI